MSIRSFRSVAAVGALALVLAACGTSEEAAEELPTLAPTSDVEQAEGDPVPSDETTIEEAVLAFTECLRDIGFEVDDPTLDADGTIDVAAVFRDADIDPESEEFARAQDECAPLLEGVAFFNEALDDPEFQDQILALTECLRSQGIDIDDPDFSNFGPGEGGGPGGGGPGIDFDDPEVAEALDYCQDQVGFTAPGGRP